MVKRLTFALPTALALFGFLLLGTACSGSPGQTDTDAGGDGDGDGDPNAIICESRNDCPDPANYECQGVCLQLCADDLACPPTAFCDDGFCRTGCRPGTCEGDQICIDGTCQDRANATTCGSKCDCDPGQVCTNEVCQDPPGECNSSADCGRGPDDQCEAFACNGFTKQCFWPNAPACVDDDDCTFRPNCEEGCTCTPSGLCVSNADCTPETETADCGAAAYCTMDLVCDPLPACTSDAQCSDLGLVCNLASQTCERPNPCSGPADCTTAPATYCDTAQDPARCVIPTCMNGGITCTPDTQTCNQFTGACDPVSMGGDTCTSNAECSNAPWPNTEYCNVPFGQQMGTCQTGCQNNLSCPDGQSCNGAHQCVVDMGNPADGAAGSPCGGIEDCQVGLVCHLLEGICKETCGSGDAPCDPATDSSCCALTGYPQCVAGLIFSFCQQ